MNSITVSDVLNLDIMEGYRIVAGKDGISNSVHYVTVYDNLITELDSNIQVFPRDIYLTTFYHGRNDEDYIFALIRQLIKINASALIVTDENISDIPPKAKDICNKANLPVIFINCKTPYSLLISQIMEYRINFDQRQSLQNKIASLVQADISPSEKVRLISEINPHFLQYVTCLYCAEDDELFLPTDYLKQYNINLLNYFNNNIVNTATAYKSGILIMITYNELSDYALSSLITEATQMIHKFRPNVQIGISNSCIIGNLGQAIQQSYTAFFSRVFDNDNIATYKTIGVSRILVELNGSNTLESFYADMMDPLAEYDTEKNAKLIETLLAFVRCDMDYKKTSELLYVHENTIRYRINLIKELIPYGKTQIDFFETISIISKIYNIKCF